MASLDGFGNLPAQDTQRTVRSDFQPEDLVAYFDETWYAGANRRARWMDLIGDYAGEEFFVIDGDSLLQMVLDDDALALGRPDDLSFQILHAKYSLERLLSDFLRRHANFDVVFWENHRYLTYQSDSCPFIFASRILARSLMLNHLKTHVKNIKVHCFASLADPQWKQFVKEYKPMFAMVNDGGVVPEQANPYTTRSILVQRTVCFQLMTQGLAITLLRGTEFRDLKILSFVFDQRLDRQAANLLGSKFWTAVATAISDLDSQETAAHDRFLPAPITASINAREAGDDADMSIAMSRVVAHVLNSYKDSSPIDNALLYVFVAHCFLLPTLSVHDRARAYAYPHAGLDKRLRGELLPRLFLSLSKICGTVEVDVDGRVFLELLEFMLNHPACNLAEILRQDVYDAVQAVWTACGSPRMMDFRALSNVLPPVQRRAVIQEAPKEASVLPFNDEIFKDAISSVQAFVSEEANEESDGEEFNLPFSDNQHWHNSRRPILPKHLGGEDKAPALTEWQRKRQLRSEQRFVAKMQWQAESLTGALGKPLERQTIVCDRSAAGKKLAPKPVQVVPKPAKNKKEHVSKAEEIRRQHAANKQAEEDVSNSIWWRKHLAALASNPASEQIVQLERLAKNPRCEKGWLAVELKLYRLHLEFVSWISKASGAEDDAVKMDTLRDHHAVMIMRTVKNIFDTGGLYPTAIAVLETVLTALGFADYLDSFLSTSPKKVEADKALDFKFVKLMRSKKKTPAHKFMPIVEDPVRWQLRLFGEYMDRSMDSQPDQRVSFQPDAWQREVLDCLDQDGHSVLVVAPTSAGKTFISYYAMEQVLKSSDDDILVYVAPTKALVSQIAAEIYARFQKSFKSSGKSVWAIHTRDYRVHNPQNCQILVTVPEMLAIMLLSPPLASTWTPRIKRIILDEIHTIGQQEGGAVWEQIILLAPCPIIGLSATIGQAEGFNQWLASVQEAHGFQHTFINHPHRYSHLRKYNYVLNVEPERPFVGLHNYQSTNRMRFLHPVSLLSFGPRSLPPDFSLEAADCLSLYNAFRTVRDRLTVDVDTLDPAVILPRKEFLKQKDVLEYEQHLKVELETLVADSGAQKDMSVLSAVVRALEDPVVASVPDEMKNFPATDKQILFGLIYLVSDLHANNELPALLFNFDRTGCEKAAQFLLRVLQKAEDNWRETSPQWAAKMQQWQTWKSQAKARQAQAEKMRKQAPDEGEERQQSEPVWQESFDPNEPLEQFSFLGKKCPRSMLNAAVEDIRWTSTPKWVLAALMRGIGIHHAGMNKHYRTTLESLYRIGHVQVVIATGTLALGINAPTKTSVFCSDSPFLTALMYRQCAGRAGRRGFDLLGKVVFYGIPLDRVQRLVLSKLPALGGNFPLTSTMVLRLCNLLHGSQHAPFAVNAIRNLLRLSQISFTSATGKYELMHHIRFSLDYLRRGALLDEAGRPVNLFGLAAHLYYTEPSNFAIVTLLRKGVLHKLCANPIEEDAKRDLLTLLCHLFCRRNVPKIYTSSANIRALLGKSPSKVILPPLIDDAKQVFEDHDEEMLHVFAGYALAFAQQSKDELGPDDHLPLSGIRYPEQCQPSPIQNHMTSTAVDVIARSPFVANSGHNDRFNSVADLVQNVRAGIHLKEHGIPSFSHLGSTQVHGLNAFILDFYTHGQVQPLVVANGIRPGDLWYLFQDFSLTLKTITTSLLHLLTSASTDGDQDDEFNIVQDVDPAEVDTDDSAGDGALPLRPRGVSDRDWKVLQVMHRLTHDFDEKFRAMWA